MTDLRILYVDDEDDIREVAAMALGLASNVDVRTSASGQQAIEDASEWKPDLILLDVMMPQMDGPKTLEALRQGEVTKDIPVVFVTARTQPYEVERFLELGAAGLIAKPFNPMTLAKEALGFLNTP